LRDNVIAIGTVSQKFLTTIPKKVRNELKLKEGDILIYRQRSDGKISIEKGG